MVGSATLGRRIRASAHSLMRGVARVVPRGALRAKAVTVMQLHRRHWREPAAEQRATRWAAEADVELLESYASRPPGVRVRLDRGGNAVLQFDGSRLLGCMWFEPRAPLYEGWLQIVIGDSDRWISDVFVDPEHRRQGVAGRLGSTGRSWQPPEVQRVAGIATSLNTPSVRSAAKAGYEIARFWYVRLLGITVVKLPGGWRGGVWNSAHPLCVPLSDFFGTDGEKERAD